MLQYRFHHLKRERAGKRIRTERFNIDEDNVLSANRRNSFVLLSPKVGTTRYFNFLEHKTTNNDGF